MSICERDLNELDSALDEETVAAIIVEPIQGEGGVRVIDTDFLRRLREITAKRQIALIFDEIQCGLGRTGYLFAYENAGVTPDMLISSEETFGPVAGISRFETEEEAIRLANDSVYGLCAYFHTRDYARLLRVAEKLEYGIVGANSGIISAANAPFGGIKESGYGREGGAFGIDEYLDVKYVLVAGVGA